MFGMEYVTGIKDTQGRFVIVAWNVPDETVAKFAKQTGSLYVSQVGTIRYNEPLDAVCPEWWQYEVVDGIVWRRSTELPETTRCKPTPFGYIEADFDLEKREILATRFVNDADGSVIGVWEKDFE